jgi:hypothetical protein
MKLVAAALVGAGLAAGVAHAAPPQIRADVGPSTVGVGDTVTYVVEARLEASGLDRSSVRVFADTGPFAEVGPAKTTRETRGSTVVITLEQRLACLDLACAPVDKTRRIRLPAAQVTARRSGGPEATMRAVPVTIAVEPRVSRSAVAAASPPYRQQTSLPAPSPRSGRLVALLTIATAVLLLAAVILAVLALRPRRTSRPREEDLVRALRLLRESANRPAPDRRIAADLVSRLVGAAGATSLADDAAHLAWSERAPDPAATDTLAQRAERSAR